MSCRHYCINSKKYLSKTFSFHKIIYKYFAGFLACIYDIIRCHYEGNARDICPPLASNPISLDCHASLRFARNDEKNIVITRFCKNRSNPKYMLCFFDNNVASAHCVNNSNRSTQGVRHRRPVGKTSCYKKLDCFAYARNDRYKKQSRNDGKNKNRTRCAPHGDDNIFCDNKNFQFDKFQRLFSVIYKKFINYKGDFKMRNQTNNVFKVKRQKSKIFITILCIFGLLFSYSCQCKNNVSDPNNIPPDNGIKTNDINPDTGDTDPDKDLVDGALSTTSTKVIVVAGAGDTVKTISTIKFKNATATLTAIADVDASANTTLAVDDFDYTGTALTFKKDTTDASKYDATTLAKVSWSGVDTKKVKATFSLTPTSENVSLTTTTQDVEIEIAKIKAITDSEIQTDLQKFEVYTVKDNIFTFYNAEIKDNKFIIGFKPNEVSNTDNIPANSVETKLKDTAPIRNMIYIKAITKVGNSLVSDDKKTWSCKYKLSFENSPYIEGKYTDDSSALDFTATITSSIIFE